MNKQKYIDEIRLELTGNLLTLEITDTVLGQVVDKALREVQRYIDSTELMTIPFASCIDLTSSNVSSVSRIYRSQGYLGEQLNESGTPLADPMYAQQWMIFSGGGSMYNLNDWVLNYAAWNTLLQMRNTATTDMAFREDKQAHRLYVNTGFDKPDFVTIEYVPVFNDVEDVKSDYWIDIIMRMSIALTKIVLGRIRSRYTQSNALWAMDGDKLLEEGNNELQTLRDTLKTNSQLVYVRD